MKADFAAKNQIIWLQFQVCRFDTKVFAYSYNNCANKRKQNSRMHSLGHSTKVATFSKSLAQKNSHSFIEYTSRTTYFI